MPHPDPHRLDIPAGLGQQSGSMKPLLLTATYVVVIFSIVVQGLTMGRVVRRFLKETA